eukprot:9146992-Lingulodinium_polyedra.AAC.1
MSRCEMGNPGAGAVAPGEIVPAAQSAGPEPSPDRPMVPAQDSALPGRPEARAPTRAAPQSLAALTCRQGPPPARVPAVAPPAARPSSRF